jgi:lysophospholipase L1-like esterase
MNYLALGDSYTIGEQVAYEKNFPSQIATLLTAHGKPCTLHKLIAVTGWTTDELAQAIAKEKPTHDYDIVTLLIGVNNQYRGRSTEEYAWQFYSLLCQAVLYAKGNANNVYVLSIPDWGLTPFNTERDKTQTSAEIDAYNAINKQIALDMNCKYVDVTSSSRLHATDTHYLAPDGLHYSEHEYAIWANLVVKDILK